MKRIKTFLISSFISALLFTNCSSLSDCQILLSNNFFEIEEYLDSLNIDSYELINCESSSGPNRQFGHSQTNSNGIFYIDSCDFKSLTINTFEFILKNSGNEQKIKFKCYQFSDDKELLVFDKFKNSMSRSMNQSKEIHTFFKKNNKWFLYYKGFP